MGKVKIKRKSTLIDMTAMSDVTVLLLTYPVVSIGTESPYRQSGFYPREP